MTKRVESADKETQGSPWKALYEEERQARIKAEEALTKASRSTNSTEGLVTLMENLDQLTVHRIHDLKQGEVIFRRLVESAHDIIFRVDLQGSFVYVNPTTVESLGFSQDELLSLNYLDLVDDNHKDRVKRFYRSMINRKRGQSYYEVPVRTKEGQLLCLGLNVSVNLNESGKPLYLSGVARDITDAKLANNRLANLIENLQCAVLLEDDKRRVVLTNDEFISLFKIPATKEQMIGVDCSESANMSKDLFVDGDSFVERIDRILEERRPVKNEVLLMKSGVVLERDYVPILIEGHHSGHMWNYREITLRKRDQGQLASSNTSLEKNLQQQQLLADISFDLLNDKIDFYRKINSILKRIGEFMDVSRVYIFEDDQEGIRTSNTFEWCNQGVIPQIDELQDVPYELISYWPNTLAEHGIIFSDDISQLPQDVQDLLSPQGIKSILVYPLMVKGKICGFIGFDECTYNRTWEQSNIQLLKTISNLIAREYERRADQMALALSEERYKGIIANMNLGLIEVDLNDRIRYANQAFTIMSGYTNDELLGQQASKLFLNKHSYDVISAKAEARNQGISDVYELEVEHKSGEVRWWFISGGPLVDSSGKTIGSIGIHLDITDRKRLESELKEARSEAELSSRYKEQFLANMSHEIRTPLNGVVGMIRELRRTELQEQQSFYLDLMKKAADNLLVILNDILDISKVEAGKLILKRNPFEFRAVLRQAVEVLRPKYEEKSLAIKIHVADEIAECFVGDEYRINQILLNLLGNAIKFTDTGEIDLTAELIQTIDEKQTLEILVRDTGIGIRDEFKDRLFQQFSQEDRDDRRRFGGTGLGLSITRQLVELMDGSIQVESEVGVGSTFTVSLTLPIEHNWQPQLLESQDTLEVDRLKTKRVLVAEDNEMNQAVIEIMLSNYGVDVVCVENGQEAVDTLLNDSFDLVLMDIQMPEMDGIAATKIIRTDLSLELPIIALTAKALKTDKIRYKEAGINAYVPKPFEEYDLLSEMIRALDQADKNK